MTFLQILNIIKDTALAQPNVNTVVREFLELNREDTKYSAVVIQDRDGLRDRIVEQDWNTYTFHLGYVDRLTFDESNRDDIFSTGINVINNIVASIRERWDLEVSIIDRFSTFNQRFTASCAGVYVVLAIQVPVSDCVDGEETDIYDKLSIDITDNGHYHYEDERPYGDVDINVNVSAQKPETSLVETITSNGSYNYTPETGKVFSDAAITVAVPEPVLKLWRAYQDIDKTVGGVFVTPSDIASIGADGLSGVEIEIGVQTENINETITSNGSYDFSASGDRYIDSAHINVSVPVKEERHLIPDTITENGEFHYTPPGFSYVYDFAEIEVDVHPTERLDEYITSNGSYHYEDDYAGVDITVAVPEPIVEPLVDTITSNGSYHSETGRPGVYYGDVDLSIDVHPSTSLVETITTNGSNHYSGEWNGADITVSVPVPNITSLSTASISGNGTYRWGAAVGEAWNSVEIPVDVHPSTSLVESITSNGSYHYTGEWNGADITVAVSAAKPEESLVETITSNGSYHYDPSVGSVFSGADISVDVHPSASLSKTYSANGTKTITGEFNGGTVTVNVHPSSSLVESITSNGSYHYTGEWRNADITVAVPLQANTLRISQSAYNNLSVKDPDTIYLIYY